MIQFTNNPLEFDMNTLQYLQDLGMKKSYVLDLLKSNRAVREGLVQVERMVSKPGITPFQQKFWVKPDQVQKTDIVFRGHQNLSNYQQTINSKMAHVEHYQPVKDPLEFDEDNSWEAWDMLGRNDEHERVIEHVSSVAYREVKGEKLYSGTQKYLDYLNKIGEEGKEVLNFYTHHGDEFMNRLARNLTQSFRRLVAIQEGMGDRKYIESTYKKYKFKLDYDEVLDKHVREHTELTEEEIIKLDKAISQYVLDSDLVVHRSILRQDIEQFLEAPDGIWQDHGFGSTTLVKGSYNTNHDSNTVPGKKDKKYPKIETKILIPKGKGRGVWLAPVSEFPNENEFLLARGTQFRIHNIKQTGPHSYYIEMEAIGRSTPAKIGDIPEPTLKKSQDSEPLTSNPRKFIWYPGELVRVK